MLFLSSTPPPYRCGLTVETFIVDGEEGNEVSNASKEAASATPKKKQAVYEAAEEVDDDEGKCAGSLVDGSACQRPAVIDGLCKRCDEKHKAMEERAKTMAASQDDKKEAVKVKPDQPAALSKSKAGKTKGLSSLLKSVAKPSTNCPSW